MIIKGKLHAETPIYRGNMRKTLFTRDGDGVKKLVSLAGEVSGTAQSLMDAFIGQSWDGKNVGLLNRLWHRLYGERMPADLIRKVDCNLCKESYPRNHFFDLRMGIKLDEDRWAAEANSNYKMESLLRNSVFDFTMSLNDSALQQGDNAAKIYYLLQEIIGGRFWFGAGKSKGLGRVRLEANLPLAAPETPPVLHKDANYLRINLSFDTQNPVLVGWNWGKLDPMQPSFSSIEARLLIESMKDIPAAIRDRLEMSVGGPILNEADWKRKFSEYLPRIIAIWLKEKSAAEIDVWVLPEDALKKLGKGKHALNKKLLEKLKPLADQPFSSPENAAAALKEAFGKKEHMAKRVIKLVEQRRHAVSGLNRDAWLQIAGSLGLDESLAERLSKCVQDEAALEKVLAPACQEVQTRLFQQVDQQLRLLQSDGWVDAEIHAREERLKIKNMLLEGKITEYQWSDPGMPPDGISSSTWKDFLNEHSRVKYRHMLHAENLRKSITNDKNQIEFLKSYRDQTRQELARPHHIDFRPGGPFNREISQKYGKPYDTIFMRMLSWTPSSQKQGTWEVYIPGSTIKGAFRKRASQLLKTLWGETRKTGALLDRVFGAQNQRGMVFFSDAYLLSPDDSSRNWCSMDGIRMNPQNGQPIETAKRDYLFAYGDQLCFNLQIDLQDIHEKDLTAVSLLFHVIQDFQQGDIPLGGEKTSGFGWVKGNVSGVRWLTAEKNGIHQKLFYKQPLKQTGIWQSLEITGETAGSMLKPLEPMLPDNSTAGQAPPLAKAGFISHRAFGGYCGNLVVEANLLTPMNIKESGEPSYKAILQDSPVYGYDFFSISPPEARNKGADRIYALPGRSIKGMLRHIYTIACDAHTEGADISRLNAAESLFGWVGSGPNQAVMGRVSFDLAAFEDPEPAWFSVPYPYGEWQYTTGNRWHEKPGSQACRLVIDNKWRLFPHAPIAPIVKQVNDFAPDTFQAQYFRAILPGARARFSVRFWNLLKSELERLIWCIALEPGLAHKMGNNRYLGFGSLTLSILPESYLIDWTVRYAGKSQNDWRLPVNVDQWRSSKEIKHYVALKKALNAEHL
jgi:CRISPR/Cas system CSM-associated protein Csm3 (group 7 of RAMP superfamily)